MFNNISVFFLIIHNCIKSQLMNKKDFFIQLVIWILFTFTPYFGLQIIFSKFSSINNNWSLWHVSLLYSILGLSYDCARMFGRSLDSFHKYTKSGQYDCLIIRPLSIFLELVCTDFFLRRIAGIVQYLIVFFISIIKLSADYSVNTLLLTSLISFLSVFFVFLGLLYIYAAICFFTVDRNIFTDLVVDTSVSIGYLPIDHMMKPIKFIFTYFIPLYFVLYKQFSVLFFSSTIDNRIILLRGLLYLISSILYVQISKVIFICCSKFYKS